MIYNFSKPLSTCSQQAKYFLKQFLQSNHNLKHFLPIKLELCNQDPIVRKCTKNDLFILLSILHRSKTVPK